MIRDDKHEKKCEAKVLAKAAEWGVDGEAFVTEAQVVGMRKVFDLINFDSSDKGTQSLEADELIPFLSFVCEHYLTPQPDEQLQAMFEIVDVSGDNEVSWAEVRAPRRDAGQREGGVRGGGGGGAGILLHVARADARVSTAHNTPPPLPPRRARAVPLVRALPQEDAPRRAQRRGRRRRVRGGRTSSSARSRPRRGGQGGRATRSSRTTAATRSSGACATSSSATPRAPRRTTASASCCGCAATPRAPKRATRARSSSSPTTRPRCATSARCSASRAAPTHGRDPRQGRGVPAPRARVRRASARRREGRRRTRAAAAPADAWWGAARIYPYNLGVVLE